MTLKPGLFIIAATSILLSSLSCGKSVDKEVITEREAEFLGGFNAEQKYIRENLHWQEPKDTIESNHFASFTVKASGEITDIEIRHPLCESCDEALFQLVKGMPKWTPALKNGKPVDSKQNIIVMFQSSYLK
jgi:hypothetical protein